MESVILNVKGMKCGGCETNVNNKLKTLEGVASSSASSKNAQVQVEFDGGKTSVAEISQAIEEAGFAVLDH